MAGLKRFRLINWWSCLSLGLAAAALPAQPWTSRAGAGPLALGEALGAAWPGLEGRAANPAQGEDQAAFLLSHTFWLQDLSADHGLLCWPWAGTAWGLEASLEQAQDVDQRDISGQPLGPATAQRQGLSLDASRTWRGWSAGLRGSWDRVNLGGQPAQWGGGAGLAWAGGHLRLGAALDGASAGLDWRASALLVSGPDQRWVLGGGYLGDGVDARWGGGLQWKPWQSLALRAGWQVPVLLQPGSLGLGSLGLALGLASGELSYAWLDEGSLGQVHRLQWVSPLALPAVAPAPSSPMPSPLATLVPPSPSPTPTPSPGGVASPTPSPSPTALARLSPTPAPTAAPSKPVNLRFVIP